MKTFFFISILLFLFSNVKSQNKETSQIGLTNLHEQTYADIENAIPIFDSIAGPFNVSRGYGKIKINFPGVIEDNSVWFKFQVFKDTLLTFDIVPIDSLHDYDFALFKYNKDKNGNFKLVKLRHCFSYCTSKSGTTGLSKYVSVNEIGAGNGPAYVSAIQAKANEIYYLMVDYGSVYFSNQYISKIGNPKGFYIYFYNHFNRSKPIVLKNVLFETNKSILKSDSYSTLDQLVSQIKKSEMVIEISGHTDNIGDANKNMELSLQRAQAVKNYLVNKMVDPNRIFCKGYGGTQPIANNNTEAGKALNRRVEMKILLN